MEPYVCKRCGHSAPQKSAMRSHLSKKKTCKPNLADIDPLVLLQELENRSHGNLLRTITDKDKEIKALRKEIEMLRAIGSEYIKYSAFIINFMKSSAFLDFIKQ